MMEATENIVKEADEGYKKDVSEEWFRELTYPCTYRYLEAYIQSPA